MKRWRPSLAKDFLYPSHTRSFGTDAAAHANRMLPPVDDELAALQARMAKLERELRETRRANEAWRQLLTRSVAVLATFAERMAAIEAAQRSATAVVGHVGSHEPPRSSDLH